MHVLRVLLMASKKLITGELEFSPKRIQPDALGFVGPMLYPLTVLHNGKVASLCCWRHPEDNASAVSERRSCCPHLHWRCQLPAASKDTVRELAVCDCFVGVFFPLQRNASVFGERKQKIKAENFYFQQFSLGCIWNKKAPPL